MSLSINTNLAALNAINNLNQTSGQLQTSINRLSTGLKINSAADDPAGFIISQGMNAQVQGIGQALQNTQDGINMLKTADGAMSEISTLLETMRSLAVGASNTAVIDSNALQADQSQIQSAVASINRIAQTTQFGTKKLLDGTSGAVANITNSSDVSSVYVGGTFGGASIQNGPVTVQVTTPATDAAISLSKSFASPAAIVPTSGSFVINGYSFSSSGTQTLQSLAAEVNNMSQTTGVTAQIVTAAGSSSIQLSQANYGSQYAINYFDPNGVLNGSTSQTSTGTDAVANVSMTTSAGVKTAVFTGGSQAGQNGLYLSDNNGNSVTLTQTGNSALGAAAQVAVVTAQQVQFQIGAYAGQSVDFSMPTTFASDLGGSAISGQNLSTIDLTTQAGAQNAISIIDSAINQVSQLRGQIGAFQQDFLQSNVNSLNIASQNVTSSLSSITDTNMAQEITNYTKLQVLQQSGMSVLAQANQQPQQILQLLKSA